MTNEQSARKLHWTFWFAGVVALIWNVMGCINFFMQMDPEMLAQMPESHREIAQTRPGWASIAFALSVFAGAIGGLLLLLKRRLAIYLFMASLVGAVITMIHAVGMSGALGFFAPFEIFLGFIMPVVLPLFFVWYASQATLRGDIS